MEPETLIERLHSRGLETSHVADWSIPSRFDVLSRAIAEQSLEYCSDKEIRINHDLRPICYHYALVLWGSEHGEPFTRLYSWLGRRRPLEVYSFFAVCIVGLLVVQTRARSKRKAAALFSLGTIGFLEITVELMMLIAYQLRFGDVYSMLSLLVCSYMGGIAVGGWYARRGVLSRPKESTNTVKRLLLLQVLAALFPLLVAALTSGTGRVGADLFVQALFVLLIFCSGAVGGALFVQANAVYTESCIEESESEAAGASYFADLLGSALGAIVVTTALLPIFGVVQSLIVASLLALGGLICVFRASFRP